MSQFYSVGLWGSSRDGLARINTKHVTSTYLKTETQSVWARNALRKSKAIEETPPAQDQRYKSFIALVIYDLKKTDAVHRLLSYTLGRVSSE